MKGLTIVRELPGIIIYQTPSLSGVNAETLESLAWPDGINSIGFLLAEPGGGPVTDGQVPEKYRARVLYTADLESIIVPEPLQEVGPCVRATAEKDYEEFKKLYLETHELFFQTWGDRAGSGLMRDVANVVEKSLPGAKRLFLEKDGAPAGMAAMIKWKDLRGEPVDWITWVWIPEGLPGSARAAAHRKIAGWLKTNVETRVQCAVNTFNLRSQKFFIKLGFRPQCIYIGKPQ